MHAYLFLITVALGAFIGPSVAGYLFDHFGFRNAVYFIIGLHTFNVFIFLCFTCCSSPPRKAYKEISSEEKLIGKGTTNHDRDNSRHSSTNHIAVPKSMNNNMVIASSFGKSNHWQRIEEANISTALLNERDDTYGSFDPDIHRETIS